MGEGMNEPARILVVDDDPRNLRLMESILRSSGYPVLTAVDGAEALEKIEADRPDLVLLDVMMPRMSGFEVCEEVRRRPETRLLPVVMVTALNALEEKVEALERGADDFLSKPVNRTELLAKMRSLLRVKALHDEVEGTRRELEEKNRELVRVEELKEKLVQMVVHDLKNPLSGIMGNLQLLEMQGPSLTRENFQEILGRTQESSRHLLGMILNLLDAARLEEGKLALHPRRCRVADLLDACVREARGMAERVGVALERAPGDDEAEVDLDRDLIGRVLANLVNHSLKHTPAGGRVEVGGRVEGYSMRFWVRDTGEGIAPDLLPRVFDKFVVGGSGEGSRGRPYGTGLGLTFCRMAVEAHGGEIGVESTPGKGSRFQFRLPWNPLAPAPGSDREEAASGTSLTLPKIAC